MPNSALQQAFLDALPDSLISLKDLLESLTADCDSVEAIREETESFLQEELEPDQIDQLFKSLSLGPKAGSSSSLKPAVAVKKPASKLSSPPDSGKDNTSTTKTSPPSSAKKSKSKTAKSKKDVVPETPALTDVLAEEADAVPVPEIIATTQVSRFHLETLETLSNDIDLKQVNITINNKPILVDANLRLLDGVHYGLIGRNGVGKSTLMKCMGYKLLIGFPKNIKILYVEQLEGVDPSTKVLDIVLDSDQKVNRVKEEAQIIQAAQESTNDYALALAIRDIRHRRLKAELQMSIEISTKRSGARGWDARKRQLVLEAEMKSMQEFLKTDVTDEEMIEAPTAANAFLEELHAFLEMYNNPSAAAKARKILKGLGLSDAWIDGPLSVLSGGWRIRVSLAQAMFMEPDMLLLDEPTNHLDLPAILWLQNYLKKLDITILVVSHDRVFLDAVTTQTIIMKDHGLTYFDGNYQEFRQNKEEIRIRDIKRQEIIDKKRAHMEKSIQEAVKSAKRSGDDKKLNQAASRQKKLDERLGLEKNAKGHRFKLNRDMIGYFENNRFTVEMEQEETKTVWTLPEPEPLRNKSSLLEVEDVAFAYPGCPDILSHVTINVQMGEKIAIVGANGQGKTTLANLIAGNLVPKSGHVHHHPKSKFAYIEQHQITSLPPNATPLSLMKERYPDEPESLLQRHLGAFGVGAIATRPVSALSGGQRTRVVVALSVYGGRHLLLLDEPTHHLDMETVEAMVESLRLFEGAVLAISHDQYFLSLFVDRVYVVGDGTCKLLSGGVEEYVKSVVKEISA